MKYNDGNMTINYCFIFLHLVYYCFIIDNLALSTLYTSAISRSFWFSCWGKHHFNCIHQHIKALVY